MLTTSDQIDQVAAAVCKVQALVMAVGKDGSAEVQTKKGGTYGYKYASLGAVLETIRKPMTDNGLALFQAPTLDHASGLVGVESRIVHTSGQWVSCTSVCTAAAGDAQAVGGAQTYMRRYGLTALLGLAAEDDDGQSARGAPTGSPPPPPKTQLDDYKARLRQRCEEKRLPVPNMDGWDVEKIKGVGVWVAKNGELPPDIEGAKSFHDE